MNLKEFKEKIDYMYERYGGNIDVTIDIVTDEELDDTLYVTDTDIWTEEIRDITEVLNIPPHRHNERIDLDKEPELVSGICISNHIIEDNNWGMESDYDV